MRQVSHFNIAGLKEQLLELHETMNEPDFWNDLERSTQVTKKVRVAENIQATDEDVENEILKYAKESERSAEERLLATLPADLRPAFEDVLWPEAEATEEELYLRRLVKAADKISALIKCVEEARSGNTEFESAEASTRAAVEDMASELPEVADFMREFFPSYGATLDDLL